MVEKVLGLWANLIAILERIARVLAVLWHEIARAVPPLGRAGAFTVEVLGKYHKDDCLSYAAGLSFWLIVSLVPLSTLLFKLLGAILGSRAYGPATLKTLEEIVPYLPDKLVVDALANSQKIGGMGLSWFVLLFGSYWGISQLDTSLAHVFGLRIKKHRQTRKNHLLRQVAFLVGGLLTMVIFLTLIIGGALRKFIPMKQADLLPYMGPLLGLLVVTMVLQHLPRLHVKFRHAFLGAAISTALWWLAKWGFGVYLRHTLTWGIMYGSLLGIVAALTFLYYSCAILLLGAEITAAFYRHESGATIVPPWLRAKAEDPAKS
ncbi:YihY/virulence factor BrkB family protein [Geothrix sp.]|uniref:YihY/virulence factor BrkB family protein n=1 Tax=Geothrix sp. TaxID=1962974 RepID=UPI0025B9DFC5|nr:YihY/virulence factor BrkB family protein [Geothrix sp.]